MLPSWSTEHSLPGNEGNETEFWDMPDCRLPICSNWDPEAILDSTATLLDGQTPELITGLVLGKLRRLEVSSEDKDCKRPCKGDTVDDGTGLPFESAKFWCWMNCCGWEAAMKWDMAGITLGFCWWSTKSLCCCTCWCCCGCIWWFWCCWIWWCFGGIGCICWCCWSPKELQCCNWCWINCDWVSFWRGFPWIIWSKACWDWGWICCRTWPASIGMLEVMLWGCWNWRIAGFVCFDGSIVLISWSAAAAAIAWYMSGCRPRKEVSNLGCNQGDIPIPWKFIDWKPRSAPSRSHIREGFRPMSSSFIPE